MTNELGGESFLLQGRKRKENRCRKESTFGAIRGCVICMHGPCHKASVLMQRLSYPTEIVLSNEITRDRIVLSFQDSPRKPLRRRPTASTQVANCLSVGCTTTTMGGISYHRKVKENDSGGAGCVYVGLPNASLHRVNIAELCCQGTTVRLN